MKKIAFLSLLPTIIFAESEFDRPSFHELRENQTVALENIEHNISDLRNSFAALSALIIETRKSNEILEEINQKLNLVVEDSQKSLFALDTLIWQQEHRLDSKPPKKGP